MWGTVATVLATGILGLISWTLYGMYAPGPPRSKKSKVAGKEGANEGPARRSVLLKEDKLMDSPGPGISTLYELLRSSAKKFRNNRAQGSRKLIKEHVENKELKRDNGTTEVRKWSFYELSPYNWLTYEEFLKKVDVLAAGLRKLGVKPKARVGMYCGTRAEWMQFLHACFSCNATGVTAYASLGEDGLMHALDQGEIECLFASADLLGTVGKVVAPAGGKNGLKNLKTVIYIDKPEQQHLDILTLNNINAVEWTELEKLGRENPSENIVPTAEDIAVIMYTSGSSGPPKGVIMTHKNIVSALGGVSVIAFAALRDTDVYLAFLPLAHVLELVVEHLIIVIGAAAGYGNPKTITEANVRNCKGDAKELRPTIMAAVPAVWEMIRKGIVSRIKTSPPLKRTIFNIAYFIKEKTIAHERTTPLLDRFIFNAIKREIGGKLRYMLTGGAPISVDTQTFLRVCFGQCIQGYGLTETCGMATLLPVDDWSSGNVGAPVPCAEIKLVDVPESGYFSKSTPPRGEIWIRGPSVSSGYFKLTKENEAFQDGWFATGDVGEWNSDGSLSIIDRKKNLVKLSHGEYVPVEQMESVYKGSHFVQNICVYAEPSRDYPIALVLPARPEIEKLATTKGISHGSWEELVTKPDVKKAVLQSLTEVGNKGKVKFNVKSVHICADDWTPENGMLTAAMKLQRSKLNAHYKKELETTYKESQ